MFSRALILKTTQLGVVQGFVKSNLFRPLRQRFIAGETLDHAMGVAEKLVDDGFFVSLDQLGESVGNVSEAEAATRTYAEIVQRIDASPKRESINISLKLTQLGFDLGDDVAERNYRQVLALAQPLGIFVRVDMESSEYTERTIRMIERVFPEFPNTGTVLQSYLHRTLDDTERLIALGSRVRMVKGAYLEPASVAYQDKAKVDEVYVEASKRLLERGNYPGIATQDEAIIDTLRAFNQAQRIGPERFEWQMLYGIRRDLQAKLTREGERLRVYLPYGPSWYPYFTRRLAERPANLMFVARNLLRK